MRSSSYTSVLTTYLLFWLFSIASVSNGQTTTAQDVEFAPQVQATCKGGNMKIKVLFNSPFSGIVHSRDFRTPACMTHGNGSNIIAMNLNLLAKQGTAEHCGILVSNVGPERAEERSVQIAVRVHKTLELADDKFYVITCGRSGYLKDENSQVTLRFYDEENHQIRELAYGRYYQLKAELSHPNGTKGIKVRNCFAFNKKNQTLQLIDDRGCAVNDGIMTRFLPAAEGHIAQAMIPTMFKFPEGAELHLQCDVIQCSEKCVDNEKCSEPAIKGARSLNQPEEGLLMATTTVFVLDPSDVPNVSPICENAGVRPHWLLWLTIVLGVLFLIMLLMNLFLCTAMSCSCARTEIIEKEPSIIEEYDPYRSWHGSQYGSRYSLHNGNGMNKGYVSGGSTIHSNRSLPIDSDHYAIVHSRPGSRHGRRM